MKQYTGTKTVLASPMTRGEYLKYQDLTQGGPDTTPSDTEGYLVEYVDGGAPNHPSHKTYISWSPKDVFERAYKASGTFLDRMRVEYAELAERSNKLLAFTRTESFTSLPALERAWLLDQFAAMSHYETILGKRLASAETAEAAN